MRTFLGFAVALSLAAPCLAQRAPAKSRPAPTAAQRAALTEIIVKAAKSKAWAEDLEKNGWTPALMTGKAFDEFVDNEFASLRGTMHLAGML